MLQLQQTIEEEKKTLEEYLKDSKENALKLVHHESLLSIAESKKYHIQNRKERQQVKLLHEMHKRNKQTKQTGQWLRAGKFNKNRTKAVQYQTLRTNVYKTRIEKK